MESSTTLRITDITENGARDQPKTHDKEPITEKGGDFSHVSV